MKRLFSCAVCVVFAALVVVPLALSASAQQEPVSPGGDAVIRLLSPDQYKLTLNNLFGQDIKVGGRFEPDNREGGLLAIGAGHASVTATGIERYDMTARTIASQVVDAKHRSTLIPCRPASATEPDDACAAKFLSTVGRVLYRRPMTPEEIQTHVTSAATSTKTLKNFYDGLALSLASMLAAPQFLFNREIAEPNPSHPGEFRLNAYSKASRLSFMLWNSGPDKELLAVAESGEIHTREGLSRQVNRLLSSPRLEYGVRAFFDDMLQLGNFDTLVKDETIYPKFTTEVARDAREQTLKTIVDHVLTRKGDYRDLFTTRHTFLTPVLGSLYRIPVAPQEEMDSPDLGWQPYEFQDGDPRAGLLAQASFVALHSHPGQSSPTLRGRALREVLLCQKVPDPPADVDFTVVQDTSNPLYKTVRGRLTAHRTAPACASCHRLMDPLGLALETFDSSGAYRTTENGVPIDTTGELNGVKFTDAASLAKAIHDSPAAASCVVNRLYSYGTGRLPVKGEADLIKYLQQGFADGGYRIPDLLRLIVTTDAFFRVAPPQRSTQKNAQEGVK